MTLRMPKDLRSYQFEKLTGVEFNDFDVDRILPLLFEMVVTHGRRLSKSDADPGGPDRYVRALAAHPGLRGFDDDHGRAVLEQWVNTSVIRMGGRGRGRRETQIALVQPIHIGAYRAGLPAASESGRHRRVHLVVYRLLQESLARRGVPEPDAALDALFRDAFGDGVTISSGFVPAFDGKTRGLDANVLLSLYYLEGFTPGRLGRTRTEAAWNPVMPGVMVDLGDQLLDFLTVYRRRLPTIALSRHLAALLNLGMFTMTLRLMAVVGEMCRAPGTRPADLDDLLHPAQTEIYVDFTRQTGGDSDRLAGECVARDLERIPAYFENMVLLKTLDRYASIDAALRSKVEGARGPDWLTALAGLRGEQYVEWRAGLDVENIARTTAAELNIPEADARDELETIAPGAPLEQVVGAIRLSQSGRAVQAAGQWFWNTGGMTRQAGLLRGNLRGRRVWRYAMTDDLLTTLLLTTMVDGDQPRPRMRLADLLDTLEHRWGLLVNHPPESRDDASSRAVASQNLAAFTGRLHQMGFFTDLADDFNAQYVINPLAGAAR